MPELISVCINTYHILHGKAIEDVKVSIPFGEYANPSFESQVETVVKGKQGGIMSIEASVEELYGDSKDDKWKKEEVKRLKAEQGIAEVEEPGVNVAAGDFIVGGAAVEGESSKQNLSDGQTGVPATDTGSE